jgi:hypothetical protein
MLGINRNHDSVSSKESFNEEIQACQQVRFWCICKIFGLNFTLSTTVRFKAQQILGGGVKMIPWIVLSTPKCKIMSPFALKLHENENVFKSRFLWISQKISVHCEHIQSHPTPSREILFDLLKHTPKWGEYS